MTPFGEQAAPLRFFFIPLLAGLCDGFLMSFSCAMDGLHSRCQFLLPVANKFPTKVNGGVSLGIVAKCNAASGAASPT